MKSLSRDFQNGPQSGKNRGKGVQRAREAVSGRDAPVRRIDVHHHILPPEYLATIGVEAIGAPAPNGRPPNWNVADSVAAMDRNGIESAVVSVSSPGIWFNDPAGVKRLARSCNHFAAQMVADHPGRFGFFASVPLPDVDASLEEAKHALDELHGDGIVLMTNYRDRYLGAPEFVRFFDALNERKAIVYVHPHVCGCNAGILPELPASAIEFPHDTTRTIASLLFSGTFSRCPDIRFIFSHAGGTLPFLMHRLALAGTLDKKLSEQVPEGVLPLLRKQRYDTALSANPVAFGALLQLVSPKSILLGTDFPFAPEPVMRDTLAGLKALGLSENDLRAIESRNAATLFPRFAMAS